VEFWHRIFSHFSQAAARIMGSPPAFLAALAVIVIWAVSGFVFQFSDTWQLVINTGTTIVTFLMVFLIQNTQNRDTLAVQVKLAELIIKMHGAKNIIAAAEDLSEEELEELHKSYCMQAEATLAKLKQRRTAKPRKAAS
jgi:low affinity Fe/Cu permease